MDTTKKLKLKIKIKRLKLKDIPKIIKKNSLSTSSTSTSSFSSSLSSTVMHKNERKKHLNCNLNISNDVNSDVNDTDNLNGISSREVLVEESSKISKTKEVKFNFEKKKNDYSEGFDILQRNIAMALKSNKIKKRNEVKRPYLVNDLSDDVSDSSDDEEIVITQNKIDDDDNVFSDKDDEKHVNEKDKVENVSGTTENEATVLDNANDQHMEDISEKPEENNQNIDDEIAKSYNTQCSSNGPRNTGQIPPKLTPIRPNATTNIYARNLAIASLSGQVGSNTQQVNLVRINDPNQKTIREPLLHPSSRTLKASGKLQQTAQQQQQSHIQRQQLQQQEQQQTLQLQQLQQRRFLLGTSTANGLRGTTITSKKNENTQTVKVGVSVASIQPKQPKPFNILVANCNKPSKSLNNLVIDLTDDTNDDDESTTNNINIPSNTINLSGSGCDHLPALVTKKEQRISRLEHIINRLTKRVKITENKEAGTITNVKVPNPGQFITKSQKLPTSGSINLNNSNPNRKTSKLMGRSLPPPLPKVLQINTNPALKASPSRPKIFVENDNDNVDNSIITILLKMQHIDDSYAEIASYLLYAYEETSSPPKIEDWICVAEFKAVSLKMSITILKFQKGIRYYFTVRAIDIHGRLGPFSAPETWD